MKFKRIDEEKYDELYITSNALRLHLEHEISPILTFLEEFNEKFVFIKDEYLKINLYSSSLSSKAGL